MNVEICYVPYPLSAAAADDDECVCSQFHKERSNDTEKNTTIFVPIMITKFPNTQKTIAPHVHVTCIHNSSMVNISKVFSAFLLFTSPFLSC